MVAAQFTTRESIFMVMVFIETQDAHETKRRFQRRFPNTNHPAVRTISHNHHKYLIHSTSKNTNKGNSGSARTPQNFAAIWRDIKRNLVVSPWKNNAPVSKTTFNRITINDLNFHLYQVHIQHDLEAGDPPRRIAF